MPRFRTRGYKVKVVYTVCRVRQIYVGGPVPRGQSYGGSQTCCLIIGDRSSYGSELNIFCERSIRIFVKFLAIPIMNPLSWFMITDIIVGND